MDCSMNFVPKMNYETLMNGYRHILHTIYSPKQYYERVRTFLKEYRPRKQNGAFRVESGHLRGFFKSIWLIGICEKGRRYYWKFFISTLFQYPRQFPLSMSLAVYGFHFRKIVEKYMRLPHKDIMDLERLGI
jgi:hypothetical protein